MEYRKTQELIPHPVSVLLYGENQLDDILGSIREFGILTPLTITAENKIISGHRRWRSALHLELETIPVEIKQYANELEEKRAILEFNRQRKKTFSQEMNEATLLEEIIAELNRQAQEKHKPLVQLNGQAIKDPHKRKTDEVVGREVGIGGREKYREAKILWNKAQSGDSQAQELVKNIDSGNKTIKRAFRELEATEKRQSFVEKKQEIPTGVFDVLYADPPWRYDFGEVSREVENQYPTMSLQELKDLSLELESHISDTAVLFLWATAPKLIEALEVMKSWGFTYRTNAVWDKGKIGMGYWFRGQHELLLVGTKGKYLPPTTEARFSSVIKTTRTDHSAKPECVYEMIEAICPKSKYLELFSRKERKGWISWGNQPI